MYVVRTLREPQKSPLDELLDARYEKYRRVGEFLERSENLRSLGNDRDSIVTRPFIASSNSFVGGSVAAKCR